MSVKDKRVLVVDDDETFRASLKSTLEGAGFNVTTAASGKAAQHLIGLEDYDTILADIRMPEGNGIELLHFVKRTKPTPVILMSGFAELSETKEAFDLGADEFLSKPFKREELVEAVEVCCRQSTLPPGEAGLSEADYCKINIDDFIAGRHIQCDIYIRVGSATFVKVAHQGADLSIDRIKAYKSKNIRHLYMRKEDFRKYVGFNLSLAAAVRTSGAVSKSKKLGLLKHTADLILEQLYFDEVDRESFDSAQMVVESTVATISDDKDLFDLLKMLNGHADFLYAHSLAVSLYGCMVSRELKWNSSSTMFKVSVGGLMHDVGCKEIDPAVLAKPRRELKPEEVKALEGHAVRGLEILGEVPSLPSDVVQIAVQHHELCSGMGFPSGLKQSRIHPLARLIGVVDQFCELVVRGPSGPSFKPKEAIERMAAVQAGAYDPTFFGALMNIFRVPMSEEIAKHMPKGWRHL